MLIVEILSPTNADDTWESIRACATIPSMAEILVVDSERRHVQVFLKNERGHWPDPGVVVEATGSVHLTSLGLEMPMAEIYAGLAIE